jgi:hypothetical protein
VKSAFFCVNLRQAGFGLRFRCDSVAMARSSELAFSAEYYSFCPHPGYREPLVENKAENPKPPLGDRTVEGFPYRALFHETNVNS